MLDGDVLEGSGFKRLRWRRDGMIKEDLIRSVVSLAEDLDKC